MTVYEIANGEASEGTGESFYTVLLNGVKNDIAHCLYIDFYEMDTTVLIKALEVLSANGNAQIFTGSGDVDSIGVKFFGT
jgi:hypothetical protein